ncbi:ABC transporter substrate-binding protein [Yinghuangia seranimata]|uniref:ABC transporter substrate-binding protein n=1 Tax=Yinghuangia seranimata TaxID=408067 RepID=UPI00248ABCDF|nr:ABC transporter substrate-binding protein [Yinghuangia seranimata]MDI2128043.1 ABC transporter substrate-binding protein [Yinghuangia seranimata]
MPLLPSPRAGRRTALATALVACTALLSACVSSDDTDNTAKSAPTPSAQVASVPGCEKGWTDPADLSPTRAPARCAPNTPAAKPLPAKTHIVVTAGTLSAEYLGPIRVAIAKGEFAKENLDVELKQMPSTDAITLLSKGEIDVLYSAPEAGMVNAAKQGFNVKWVLGNYSSDPKSKSGVWVRLKDGQTADQVDLKGKTFGSLVGKTSIIMYPIASVLEKHNTKVTDVQFKQLDAQSNIQALQNGGVDAAWLLDPAWKDFENKPGYAFLGGQPAGEPIGGMLYGPSLLDKNRAAGTAFARAMIRTVSTYFAGDYKADPAFVQELAQILGNKPELLAAVPSLVTDWEIRKGTVDKAEKMFVEGEVVQAPALPEDKLVDRSFYAEAVGHSG